MPLNDLRSVRQLAAEVPVFTEASIRWMIFNAPHNGLAPALVRVGDRVFIDRSLFEKWIFSRHQAADAGAPVAERARVRRAARSTLHAALAAPDQKGGSKCGNR